MTVPAVLGGPRFFCMNNANKFLSAYIVFVFGLGGKEIDVSCCPIVLEPSAFTVTDV